MRAGPQAAVAAGGPGSEAARVALRRPRRSGRLGERIFGAVTGGAALAVVVLVGALGYELVSSAAPALKRFGLGFLWSTEWDPVRLRFGALPFIYGTLVSSFLALAIALPLSVGLAIFLVELCPLRLRAPVAFLGELLAAIPSVVYGLWGIFFLAPWMQYYVEPALRSALGFLPFFRGPAYGVGMLTAAVILAVMIVPFISSVAREVLAQVPDAQREAALALGATRWEMIRMAVLPYGRAGILGAAMLGLGRALGETMAVTMVIGNRPEIALSLFAPGYTMAAVIANEFTEATDDIHLAALVAIGLVLFATTLLVNLAARLIVWRAAGQVAGEGGQ